MKIEYLAEGAPDCPLIRIFDASIAEFSAVHAGVFELANGTASTTELHKASGVQLINLSELTLMTSRDTEGVQEKYLGQFYWLFPQEKWKIVAGLIEPFTKQTSGPPIHQWLCGRRALLGLNASQTSVLISQSGQW
jgi:hypothetical protein